MTTNTYFAENGLLKEIIRGRRNWVIRQERKYKVARVGGFGEMDRCGLMCESLTSIADLRIWWAEYTYKKDLINALKLLEEQGYKIVWLD